MNFERGISPTRAMDIGQVALAPKISVFSILDPSNMTEGPDGKLRPAISNMGKVAAIDHLNKIQNGEPPRKLRFYGFYDEKDEFHRLSEYKGLYVEFDGIKYKIP